MHDPTPNTPAFVQPRARPPCPACVRVRVCMHAFDMCVYTADVYTSSVTNIATSVYHGLELPLPLLSVLLLLDFGQPVCIWSNSSMSSDCSFDKLEWSCVHVF